MTTPLTVSGTSAVRHGMICARKPHILGALVAALLALPSIAQATTVVCKELRLKPLHCVRGFVIDETGALVPGAKVTIIASGAALAIAQTDEKGQFSFGELKPGSYQLRCELKGFRTELVPIVVKKHKGRCKKALEILLTLGYPYRCTSVRIVKR